MAKFVLQYVELEAWQQQRAVSLRTSLASLLLRSKGKVPPSVTLRKVVFSSLDSLFLFSHVGRVAGAST